MYKAVLVDDEETIITGLSRLLPWQKYGCEVVGAAHDGNAGLQLVRKLLPDILFTDIRMPGMDGLSMIAALRSEFPDMQISILSGYPEFDYAREAIRLGVCRYVVKPSKMDELEAALRDMTDNLNSAKANGLPDKNAEIEARPGFDEADEARDKEDAAANFIIKNAMRYMEQHYAEKLTLPDVAQQVYVSQWHLSKLISRSTGQSFSDLLNGVRIAEAKRLLADPGLKVWEVSERVGFSDVTHFSRMFKKLEGVSANEYRMELP